MENTGKAQEEEISLKELILKMKEWWAYLWSKKLIIIAAGIFGGLLGLGYAFIKKPIYTATTTFVLETGEKSGGLGQFAGMASMMGIDLGGGGGGIFQGDNILELYKSRKMIEKTLFGRVDSESEELLIERFAKFNDLYKKWEKDPKIGVVAFKATDTSKKDASARLKDSLITTVVEAINKTYLNVGKPDKKLSLVKVSTSAEEEVFAKRFNEELVKNVNDFYVQTKTKKSLENVAILQHKTDSVRAVMNGAIYKAVVIVDATPNLNPSRQVQRVAPVQKAQFSSETNKAVLSELVKNLEMSKISLLKETPLIQVIDEPFYPLKKEKLGKIKGIVLGSVVFSFFSSLFLIFRKLIKLILSS